MIRSVMLTAVLAVATAFAVDTEDAPKATYQCTFQQTHGSTPGAKVETKLEVQSGCTVTDELAIGGYLAMAQGCSSKDSTGEKNDVELFVYPEAGMPQATSAVHELAAHVETSFLTASDKFTLTCLRK